MKLTCTSFITLDGVVQSPAAPDEDTRGSFTGGGWYAPYDSDEINMDEGFSRAEAFLLGRRTYETFAEYWPTVTDDNPAAAALNRLPKYVASTTMRDARWGPASVIADDLVARVTELKQQPGQELQVHGSGGLAQTLMAAGLIDAYHLLVVPVLVGSGRRLFNDGILPTALRLVASLTTSTGVTMQTYETDGALRQATFAPESEEAGS